MASRFGAHPLLCRICKVSGPTRDERSTAKNWRNCLLSTRSARLKAFLDAEGRGPQPYQSPHGALYGMAARMEDIAEAVADAAGRPTRLPLFGMKGTLPRRRSIGAAGHTFVAPNTMPIFDYKCRGVA